MKNCPHCGEEIQDAAIKCKHCRKILEEELPPITCGPVSHSQSNPSVSKGIPTWGIIVCEVLFLPTVFLLVWAVCQVKQSDPQARARFFHNLSATVSEFKLGRFQNSSGSGLSQSEIEGMFADYLAKSQSAMALPRHGNSINPANIRADTVGLQVSTIGFGKITKLNITNHYMRRVDGEKAFFYDADIFTDTPMVGPAVWHGSIVCVRRGERWYWEAQTLPEYLRNKHLRGLSEYSQEPQ